MSKYWEILVVGLEAKTEGLRFSDVCENRGFPPEAACRSKVDPFWQIFVLKGVYNAPQTRNMRILATAGTIYYILLSSWKLRGTHFALLAGWACHSVATNAPIVSNREDVWQ